jgi:hypothetical protein
VIGRGLLSCLSEVVFDFLWVHISPIKQVVEELKQVVVLMLLPFMTSS